jgi:phage-related protein
MVDHVADTSDFFFRQFRKHGEGDRFRGATFTVGKIAGSVTEMGKDFLEMEGDGVVNRRRYTAFVQGSRYPVAFF